MANYYNENDPYTAQWLRNLIKAGEIPDGVVDDRSITEVRATDLLGFTQHHFFAGISGWSRALQIAGFPPDRPVVTASCPCQPFSGAGGRGGEKDERHLWPELYRLISECRPELIFGEQTSSGDGPEWLDGISLDLEELGYRVGSSDLPAASVNAPHRRQRLWWVAQRLADAGCPSTECGSGSPDAHGTDRPSQSAEDQWQRRRVAAGDRGADGRLGNTLSNGTKWSGGKECQSDATSEINRMDQPNRSGRQPWESTCATLGYGDTAVAANRGLEHTESRRANTVQQPRQLCSPQQASPASFWVDNTTSARCTRERISRSATETWNETWMQEPSGRSASDFWDNYDFIPCSDGKTRRLESGCQPLVTRLSEDMGSDRPSQVSPFRTITDHKTGRSIGQAPWRIGMLRGYGNSIVPQLAAVFIRAFLDCEKTL